MLLTKRFILSLVLCFIGFGVFAQSADDIIAKYVVAMGGKDRLMKLNSVYEETTTTVMGQEIPSKLWLVNNKGMRTEMSVMGQKIITSITKDTGWMVNPMMGNDKPQALPTSQLKESISKLDLRGQLVDYKAKGYTVTLVGKETINGKDNYKLKVTKGSEQAFTFYIDASTYLLSRIQADIKTNGMVVNSSTDLGDYKKTPDGFVFPYTTTINVNPGGEIKSTINKITVNPTIDPAIFLKP